MNRWNDRLRRLLYGRYGSDRLMWALLALVGIFMFLSWLTSWRMWWFFSVLVLAVCYFRIFSRDVQTHRHFNCPGCSQPLRVPRGRGRIEIRCPRCGYSFKRRT